MVFGDRFMYIQLRRDEDLTMQVVLEEKRSLTEVVSRERFHCISFQSVLNAA